MKEYRVSSFNELHEILASFRRDNRWVFRGQSNAKWQLIPKVGRPPFDECDDKRILEAWKRRALEFMPANSNYNNWDWLSIAQHYGLATCLLDWTLYPLTAAFFAARHNPNGKPDHESAIFAFQVKKLIKSFDADPFNFHGIALFKPRGVAPRIMRQGGLFTIHRPSNLSIEEIKMDKQKLVKIIIDPSYREELTFELSQYGYNMEKLFPDLDGLSAHINWAFAHRDYWDRSNEIKRHSYRK